MADKQNVQAMIVENFKKFDQNGDGKISRDELKRVLNTISGGKSKFDDGAVDALLNASDTNKDGFIQYEEFVTWVTKDMKQKPQGDTQCNFNPLDKRGEFKVDYRKLLPERFDVDIAARYDLDGVELGAGGFGKVFIARDKQFENRTVAVKKVQKPQPKDSKDKQTHEDLTALKKEIEVMKEMDHPNICKLLATFEAGPNMFFIMELCEGGEVFDRIIESGCISERTTSIIIQQVCSALAHAHGRGVAHRDIKPENVVFCSKDRADNTVKLIDWGLASFIQKEGGMTKAVGSMTYAAPEVISSQDRKVYTEACDLWSTGVMTYVMLCGKPPFWGTREQHYKAAKNERYPFKDAPWDKMNAQAKDFVARLLKASPSKRMPIKDTCAHPWLHTQKESHASSEASSAVFASLSNFTAQSTFKRMCITAVARQLDHTHLKDIHQVFRDMDANGDGVLSLEEVKNGFKKLDAGMDMQKLEDVFARMDMDDSKSVDYTEFCAAGLDQKTSTQDDVIWAAFKTFDKDNTGYISIENLKDILASTDMTDAWSADVCKDVGAEIVAKFDKDGDGRISFEDWRGLMQTCWSKGKAPAVGNAESVGAYDLLVQVSELKAGSLD